MAQREQLLQDPAGQTSDPLVNQFNPNRSHIAQADLHGWQQQIIDGAIFKPRFSRSQVKAQPGGIGGQDRGENDGSTGKPGTAQFAQGAFACQQTAHACWKAEEFIERKRNEVWMPWERSRRLEGA